MQSEKFKVTPLERSWILYDVGNSAFVLMIATLVPIFFNALAEAGGVSKVDLYFQCKLNNDQSLIINAVTTYIDTQSDRSYTEGKSDEPLTDIYNIGIRRVCRVRSRG